MIIHQVDFTTTGSTIRGAIQEKSIQKHTSIRMEPPSFEFPKFLMSLSPTKCSAKNTPDILKCPQFSSGTLSQVRRLWIKTMLISQVLLIYTSVKCRGSTASSCQLLVLVGEDSPALFRRSNHASPMSCPILMSAT